MTFSAEGAIQSIDLEPSLRAQIQFGHALDLAVTQPEKGEAGLSNSVSFVFGLR